MQVSLVMAIALTLVTAFSSFFYLDHSQLHPVEYPHHCADDHYCFSGHRGRSNPEGSRLRDFQTAVGVCWFDHYELYCYGASRGVRHEESPSA